MEVTERIVKIVEVEVGVEEMLVKVVLVEKVEVVT